MHPNLPNLTANIWVIDDDVALRTILEDTLTDADFSVYTFGNAQLAWQTLQHTADLPNVIITDIRMPLMDGLTFSEKLHASFPQIPVIIITAHADVQSAVDSYQTGAFDYLPKPFELDDVVSMVQKAVQQNAKIRQNSTDNNIAKTTGETFLATTANTQDSQENFHNPNGIIGNSVAMQQVFRAIGRLSNTAITVLVTGESGTGKELIAHALHEHSPRKNKPFIALNMSAIPHDLIESELFGHEKGAFTGATTARQGRFEQAHGGTLFLDEIGDMPLSIQTRLLRVLANGEFFRVGGQKPIKVDVRIIAATHQPLENLVKLGKFREDLFYRLNVIRLALPALRERRTDIPLLVHFFMQNIANNMQMPVKTIADDAMQVLVNYDWRGNVRQLENACRYLTVMAVGQQVQLDDLPLEILAFDNKTHQPPSNELRQYSDLSSKNALVYTQNKATNADIGINSISQPLDNFIQHKRFSPNKTPAQIQSQSITPSVNPSLNQTLNQQPTAAQDWLAPLQIWAKSALQSGQHDILQTANQDFERCLLQVALTHTGGHKGKAADLLGWGRNTLTRKLQQFSE